MPWQVAEGHDAGHGVPGWEFWLSPWARRSPPPAPPSLLTHRPGRSSGRRTGGDGCAIMAPLMNIVVSNVKGGVGKTTTAIYLASAAVARGLSLIHISEPTRR